MKVLVTGGGTIAPIDDVRQIRNVSTGRFSSEISEAWIDRGDSVWHLATPGSFLPFLRQATLDLTTDSLASEICRLTQLHVMWKSVCERLNLIQLKKGTVGEYAQTLRQILDSNNIDVVFLVAAVSDYEPLEQTGKISSDQDELVIRCRKTPKVIRQLRDWAPDAYIIGFKLLSGCEQSALVERAKDATVKNRVDLTVANDLAELRAGAHRLQLVRPGQESETLGPRPDLARQLVGRVAGWVEESRNGLKAR